MIQKSELVQVWTTMKVTDIAAKHSMTIQAVYSLARRCGLPGKMELAELHDGPGEDDPTPEQIAERAKVIRDSWSDAECERRWMGKRRIRYEFPRIETAAIFGTSEAASYSRV
jgi:hypothetical protein